MSETILPEVFASPMPVAAPGLLDEIMAQTRFKPESESYDIPCKKYPQVIAGIEQIRMLKGGTFSYRWLPP
ncbi:hypothetical protein [Citrobacter freundii]|uniref:hypothetical protein n=1 Tax=Citrobacter freundii TaxID=546 RepID=UPI000EF27107|nr:hypothetical protein [Citrobacter freundii]AYL48297.1 hypothetical protein CUC46_16370 [Citrobacter freundii]